MSAETAAAGWLAKQDEGRLRIAREITYRREALRKFPVRADSESKHVWENGLIAGLRLALSYLSDRPGDISQTGAEGFILNVESADKLARVPARAGTPEEQR